MKYFLPILLFLAGCYASFEPKTMDQKTTEQLNLEKPRFTVLSEKDKYEGYLKQYNLPADNGSKTIWILTKNNKVFKITKEYPFKRELFLKKKKINENNEWIYITKNKKLSDKEIKDVITNFENLPDAKPFRYKTEIGETVFEATYGGTFIVGAVIVAPLAIATLPFILSKK